MPEAVILEAIRTPFARRGGALRETHPDRLLAHALEGLVKRVGLDPAKVEDVVNGTVTQAGEQGANVGRLGALFAGFPVQVPAVTLNRMSPMQAWEALKMLQGLLEEKKRQG